MPPNPPEKPSDRSSESQPKPKPSRFRELLIRVASALVLIPCVLLVISLPLPGMPFSQPWPFLVLISIGVALLSIEWGAMIAPNAAARLSVAISIAILMALFAGYLGHPVLSFLILAFGSLCAGLYAYRLKSGWMDAAYGVFYIGFPAIIVVWLRSTDRGLYWVFFAFLIAWAADSAAYIVGKTVGGPKLWRRYSPNKTWSGFAGGMIAGMLTAGTLSDLTHVFHHDTSASFVGLLVALATMAGDLWESALKRRYGVKDAGSLIPGHGGLLDRVDGLMFAIVALGVIRLLVMLGTVIL